MSSAVTYVFSLTDRMSAPLRTITGASSTTTLQLGALKQKSDTLKAATASLGGSLSVLRQRMELLRAEKEIINPKNFSDLKRYNKEIASIEKQIDKLDNAGRKGGLSSYFKDLKSTIGAVLNPLTIAAAAGGFVMKDTINLDEQFAKVNITAQMEGADFEQLKTKIKGIAKRNKVDIGIAPTAFEKILSQTNDVDLSLSILDSTLKGSKAGFTDAATVSDALAQTLSSVGKESANAQEILDTLFAAKRVGAGEFRDFATYIPGLVASGKSLKIGYKEVAGIFAYMTSKGNSAERAAVLMNNMLSLLGRGEVTGKLQKVGVNVFDNGELRSTVDIFKDMKRVMDPMNGQQRSKFIESMGIVDKEAKSAFMLMSDDVAKLEVALASCANASGETDRALAFSANTAQRASELWASFKGNLLDFGTAILPMVDVGIMALGGALEIAGGVVTGVSALFGGWYDALADGSPLIWGLTAALTASGVVLSAHKIKLIAISTWNGITTFTTGLLGKATLALNSVMAVTPWGVAIIAGAALAATMGALLSKTDGATKGFRDFRVEVEKTRAEANDSFSAAMKAASGSDQRASAIKRINEQYSEYLPHMLTEKSSNIELATAMQTVNDKLEETIRLKFRNMRIEAIENTKDAAKKELFDWVAERVAPDRLEEALSDLSTGLVNMQDGRSSWVQIQEQFKSKYDVGGYEFLEAFKNVNGGGFNPLIRGGNGGRMGDGTVYNAFGKRLLWMSQTNAQGEHDRAVVDAQYSTSEKQSPVSTATIPLFVNGVYQAPGAALGRSALMAKPGDASAFGSPVIASKPSSAPVGGIAIPSVGAGSPAAGGSSNSDGARDFDLNTVQIGNKGNGTYSAIMSQFKRVKMASLTTAATMAMAAPMQATAMPHTSEGAAMPTVSSIDNERYSNKNKPLNLDKFCDQIVIHIGKADNQGMDEIRRKVIEVLKEVADGR